MSVWRRSGTPGCAISSTGVRVRAGACHAVRMVLPVPARRALVAVALAAACTAAACNTFGPPPPSDAPPPHECQQIIDQCSGPAAMMGAVSAADDCVRIARDMTTTAAHCVEIAPACTAACTGAAGDATAGE